ncbi:MAG: hypothetical protein MUP74_04575 [Desulfobacterales bacterium]|nr:hypothetical protein [Desulfobacterales bacterium]
MSEVKAPKKGAAEPKKLEAKTPEIKKPEVNQSTTATETTSADKSAAKSDPTPKSASQSSISHFSSVSTPEYRAGWNSIFGGGKATKKTKSKNSNGSVVPEHFSISDANIDAELRNLLDKAFQKQVSSQGIDLSKIKKSAVIEYIIDCSIRNKYP